MNWVRHIDQAIDDVLQPSRNGYIIHREYMDTKRQFSPEYLNLLKQTYQLKYKNIHLSAILASDNNAFDFLRANRDTLFGKNTPVIFCGVNDFHPEMLKGIKYFTGAAEVFNARKTVLLAKKIIPDLKNVLVVNDYLVTGRAWTSTIKKQLKGIELNITYAPNLSMQELQNKIASLPPHSATLLGVYYKDRDGKYFTYEKVGKILAEKAKQPVFALLRFNIGHGIIGGDVIGGYSQGEAMSQIALKVLHGANPNQIPVLEKGVTKLVIDYPSLKRYGLHTSTLPKEALVLNKPISFYQMHKNIILVFLTLTLFLIIIIALQYRAFKKQSQSQKQLQISDKKIHQLNEKLVQETIETQNLFETFFENLPIPLFYKDKNGRYLGANKKFNKLYGFDKDFLIGKKVTDIAPPELASKYQQQDLALLNTPDEIQVYEAQILNQQTKEMHQVIFHKNCFFDVDGNIQGIIGAILDITELKQKEAQLRQANEQSQRIIDNVMEGILIHNHHECVHANATALKLFGTNKTVDIVGKPILDLVTPEDQKKLQQSMQQDFPQPYEVTAYQKDGTPIPVLIKPFKLLEQTEKDLRIVAIMDLRAVKAKEQALTQAKLHAEAATQAKAQFLANMSHELRTPLNAILGLLYALSKELQSPEQVEKMQIIEHSARHLLQLINDILDYSKLESQKLTINQHPFSLYQLITEIQTLLQITANSKGIQLKAQFFPNNPDSFYVIGDEVRVKQIIMNLVGNAIKFTHQGSVQLKVHRVNPTDLKIEVIDTGIGIPEKCLKTIFDSFSQVENASNRTYTGTGLGLSITKQLVELMDGQISVKSKENKGSTFTLTIKLPQTDKTNEMAPEHFKLIDTIKEIPSPPQTPTKPPLSQEKKCKLINQLRDYIQSHQAKDAKNTVKEILTHQLEENTRHFYTSMLKILQQRQYKLALEMIDDETNHSRR